MVIEATGASFDGFQIAAPPCKPVGTFVGQTAFGSRVNVRRQICEEFRVSDELIELQGKRIRMSADQFRAIWKSGVKAEVDFLIGDEEEDMVVQYR